MHAITDTAVASGLSGHLDTRTAATEVGDQLHSEIGGACDLLIFFASFHHRAAFEDAAATLRRAVAPRVMLGSTAESVVGGANELEGRAGFTAIAMRMPGMDAAPWISTPDDPIRISRPESIPARIGIRPDTRATIILGDPFTTPISRLLPALAAAGADGQLCVVGGMASGASRPGHNALVVNDRVTTAGAIGVTLSGHLRVSAVVSQGCRPIGRPLVVTKAQKNVILELGGHKAIDALRRTAAELDEREQSLLGRGVLIGSVIDEHRSRWGRGDFLVRNILGLDQEAGGIVAGDMPRVGQTVQFHVRDAATATEDLQLLLDAQQVDEPPLAALLFTCNGRGHRLFEEESHDAGIIRDRLGDLPLAGFFAAGEIGPIGGRSFLHGHTACLALIRR